MASYRIGSGYKGTPSIQTSTANQEIIPPTPAGWSGVKLSFYKFSFQNKANCTVKINGGDPIYLEADDGFEVNLEDAPITSFVIVEAGIQFKFIGAY